MVRILSRLVVPWAPVTTNCLQDLETRRHESRIQLLQLVGRVSWEAARSNGISLVFLSSTSRELRSSPSLCGKVRNFSRSMAEQGKRTRPVGSKGRVWKLCLAALGQ